MFSVGENFQDNFDTFDRKGFSFGVFRRFLIFRLALGTVFGFSFHSP